MPTYCYPEDRIAVVGMGGVFPDAPDLDRFWRNILEKRVSIRELPDDVVDGSVYYRPECRKASAKADKSYTRLGAFLGEEYKQAVRKYRIPPAVAEHMDDNQHGALYSVDQALQWLKGKPLPRDRTAVIIGNGATGLRFAHGVERCFFQLVAKYLRGDDVLKSRLTREESEALMSQMAAELLDSRTNPTTEDTAPGVLPNVVAGRISNVFDLRGPSYTVDAACASALAAVNCAVMGLQCREFDVAVCGAADTTTHTPWAFVMFSAINALSPDGSFPFDRRANGFVMGQGAGVVILKRLSDALRDEDAILGLVAGYGQGSDGKGKYIAAPSEEGQVRVIEQACRRAGYSADSIELVEAHGTGTAVGDPTEVNALKRAFASLGATRVGQCALGSVKSNIGHLKSAAGAPGLIKAILAMHHKTLPPTASVTEVNPRLGLEGSPFYVITEQKPWAAVEEHPRRSNVSAFGFGGADYHLALEEYREEFRPSRRHYVPASAGSGSSMLASPHVRTDAASVPQAVFFSAESVEELARDLRRVATTMQGRLGAEFAKMVALHDCAMRPGKRHRAAIMAGSGAELEERASELAAALESGQEPSRLGGAAPRTWYRTSDPIPPSSIAVLFPGQASQYPNMLRPLVGSYSVLESVYAQADLFWEAWRGRTISSLLFGEDEVGLDRELRETENTHPAMFLSSYALFRLLSEMGLRAEFMAGHSLGEITALTASGMLSFRDGLELVGARGYSFAAVPAERRGRMVSIRASLPEVEELLAQLSVPDLWVCNVNGPRQVIVGGTTAGTEALTAHLAQRKTPHTLIKVSHAFHSPLIGAAADRFYEQLQGFSFAPSATRVMASHLPGYYPTDEQGRVAMASLLRDQLASPVRFASAVRKLYGDGVRLFVEVGPGSVLGALVRDILSDAPDAVVLSANHKGRDAHESLGRLLAQLFVAGVPVQPIPIAPCPGATTRAEASLPRAAEPQDERPRPGEGSGQPVALPAPAREAPRSASNGKLERSGSSGASHLVYSGVSVGLPGTFKNVFRDDNFDLIFSGRNLLEKLPEQDLQRMAELNITRVVKSASGAAFKELSSVAEVIQLAGRLGKLDMVADYKLDEKELRLLTSTVRAAIAAGYEALADAGIPLVLETIVTSTGSTLPGRLALPKEMQNSTGIIFANGFPMVEPFIEEVSRFVAAKYGGRLRKELLTFYESIIQRVADPGAKKLLSDWFVLHYARLSDKPGEEDAYKFNHLFMGQVTSQANNAFAQLIGAGGPNFQLQATCSSTAYAITQAEQMIRSGLARRMIVIGADDPSSRLSLPWIGAGFLSTGAATASGDVCEAATPFDRRRNGMLIGAAAVGIVIEKEEDVRSRGMDGICQLLGTHAFNTAGSRTRIDPHRFAAELEIFMSRMEREHGFARDDIAGRVVYFSHEPYTPPEGGCSQTEHHSLTSVFGARTPEVIVCNTKGFTGHTMGASVEDVVAARSLQRQRIPPVANYSVPDPTLPGLTISRGGNLSFDYALRLIAGFGGQGNFNLLKRVAGGDQRISDELRYRSWLRAVGGEDEVKLETQGRLLVLNRLAQGTVSATAPQRRPSLPAASPGVLQRVAPPATDRARVAEEVLKVFAQITKYPQDSLGVEMEMEADLGIDTVKQATILSMLAEKYGLPQDETLQLASLPTIGHIIDLTWGHVSRAGLPAGNGTPSTVLERVDGVLRGAPRQAAVPAAGTGANGQTAGNGTTSTASGRENGVLRIAPTRIAGPGAGTSSNGTPLPPTGTSRAQIAGEVLALFAEVTKYAPEMLSPEMEMEADLGIDTVKQATILSMLAEKRGLPQDDGLQLSSLPTIGHIIDLTWEHASRAGQSGGDGMPAKPSALEPGRTRQAISDDVIRMLSENTRYPEEMLELDMEMKADLGIDPDKQAAILSLVTERFGLQQDAVMQAGSLRTIGDLVGMVSDCVGSDLAGAAARVRTAAAGPRDAPPVDIAYSTDGANGMSRARGGTESAELLGLEPDDLSWQVPVLVDEDVGQRDYSVAGKSVLVVGDHGPTVLALEQALGRVVGNARSLTFAADSTMDALRAGLQPHLRQPLDVIVDCTHLGASIDLGGLSPVGASAALFLSGEARFLFYKGLVEALPEAKPRILCLVAVDGGLGYADATSAGDVDATFGGLTGFYKGLRRELHESRVRIVDVGPQGAGPDVTSLCKMVVDNVESDCASYEIAYSGPKRRAIRMDVLDRGSTVPVQLPKAPHFLITGGARGITAEITIALARRHGGRFSLLGTQDLPEGSETWAILDEEQLQARRQEIHQKLKTSMARVTPALVEAELNRLAKVAEIQRTLREVRAAGAQVGYFPCDVRDAGALERVFAEAREVHGPVDVLVHAAGVERSHRLKQKPLEEFREVFSVKALAACHLSRLCRAEPPSAVVVFSSISGRFGNDAQLDYCAANGFLGLWTRALRSISPGLHAVCLAWSGWKDVGMAWRNEFVKQHSEKLGLNLIEPRSGVTAFLRALENRSCHSEIVLSRGLNGMMEPELSLLDLRHAPLVDWVVRKKGQVVRAHKVLSVVRDSFMDQHRLAETAIVPAAASMELLTEFFVLQEGAKERYVLRDLSFPAPIKLFHDRPREIFLEGEPLGGGAWRVSLRSRFVPLAGGPTVVTHAQGTVASGMGDLTGMDPRTWKLLSQTCRDSNKRHWFREHQRILAKSIRLGPLYRDDVTRDEDAPEDHAKVCDEGMISLVRFPTMQLNDPLYPLERLAINPCFVDTVWQAAAEHSGAMRETVYLPYRLQEFGVLKVPRREGLFNLYTELQSDSKSERTYNIVVADEAGETVYYARNATVHGVNQ